MRLYKLEKGWKNKEGMQKSRSGGVGELGDRKEGKKREGYLNEGRGKAKGHRRKSAGIIFSTQVIKNTILVIFGCCNKTPWLKQLIEKGFVLSCACGEMRVCHCLETVQQTAGLVVAPRSWEFATWTKTIAESTNCK